ncbi:hypothetical protein DBR40_23900 [Pedobacter sp. KBW01]|uniref:DUF4262 domain-containing protein n=1 Tax=Pedobacter sp. KBW01 TaxID=2153364 RepID=UPI000F5A6EF0|nr:DUF4262 domain-containing protein [Pedobacter sp. KBW01]RQO65400.1 hypothetical protein DBR40_23900 [Pedobacter sp. KBW01]
MTNKEFLNIIRTNIDKNGYHITLVNGGQHPDFSYSIGLTEELGFELIMAGGFNSVKDNEVVFDHVISRLRSGYIVDSKFSLPNESTFYLRKVDPSWAEKMMLGVYDYYDTSKIIAYQIIPVKRTLDIPLMSESRNLNDPIWKWLDADWNIKAPVNSYVITDFDALTGKTITELTRWEEGVWEMFSGPGPDVKEEDIRIVPLGTILGIDTTLWPIIDLSIGEGLWRESKDSDWQKWE